MANGYLVAKQGGAARFQIDFCGVLTIFAFTLAATLCLVHGDFVAIPGILVLGLMTFVAVAVRAPAETAARKARSAAQASVKTFARSAYA